MAVEVGVSLGVGVAVAVGVGVSDGLGVGVAVFVEVGDALCVAVGVAVAVAVNVAVGVGVGSGNSRRTMWFDVCAATQMFPSGPVAMPRGPCTPSGRLASVMFTLGERAMRPTRDLVCSVNQSAPSGPSISW